MYYYMNKGCILDVFCRHCTARLAYRYTNDMRLFENAFIGVGARSVFYALWTYSAEGAWVNKRATRAL